MEPRFGADFSNIRIHSNTESASLSNQLSARAFTYQNHVFFSRDQYQPGTSEGRQLLAHELTHTIQQGHALQRSPQVRAILCSNDMLAAGVLFECQRRGIEVPARIAVMGFADLPIAAATEPTLTTVHVPSYEIGRRAGDLLLARIHGEAGLQSRVDLGYRVLERASA